MLSALLVGEVDGRVRHPSLAVRPRAGVTANDRRERKGTMKQQDERAPEAREHDGSMERRQYARFLAMIATSTVVMFCLTYTNTYAWDHVRWSEERLYMALLMGGAMAVVMLAFMWGMHKNRRVNIGIVAGAVVLMGVALWLSRSQRFVDDREYMKGMIPHHSIAILTSEHADIDDLRVCELANGIIKAQRKEIAEMDWLIDDIAEHGEATTAAEVQRRPVPSFSSDNVRETC
jgi:hypothetical protein